MLGKGAGAMSHEEVTVTKAPKHADTWQPAVAGCFYVYIAVADIDHSVGVMEVMR
jgi:hypothetical protein